MSYRRQTITWNQSGTYTFPKMGVKPWRLAALALKGTYAPNWGAFLLSVLDGEGNVAFSSEGNIDGTVSDRVVFAPNANTTLAPVIATTTLAYLPPDLWILPADTVTIEQLDVTPTAGTAVGVVTIEEE